MVSVEEVKILNFSHFEDKKGHLVPLEENGDVPFSIKRVFYIYGVASKDPRGAHSHLVTEQLLICLSGKCEVKCSDGKNEKIFLLSSPTQGLHIPAMIWGEQIYDKDTVMLILASTHYDKSDYIEDWNVFVRDTQK